MTVQELIAELSKYPPDAEVRFEAECVYDDMPDLLVGTVESVSISADRVVLACDGMSKEDREMFCDDCGDLVDYCECEDESDLPHDEPDEEDDTESSRP